MNQVTFKTFNGEEVWQKLINCADRVHAVHHLIAKTEEDPLVVRPILQDISDDLADLFFDVEPDNGGDVRITKEVDELLTAAAIAFGKAKSPEAKKKLLKAVASFALQGRKA